LLVERSPAQSSSPKAAPGRTQARTTLGPVVEATLAQLMRGILFPDSNVIFAAQSHNPAEVPPAKDPFGWPFTISVPSCKATLNPNNAAPSTWLSLSLIHLNRNSDEGFFHGLDWRTSSRV